MFMHQVVGIHKERSRRSGGSKHIVGICTLEAIDASGRFHDFAPTENWRAEGGRAITNGQTPRLVRCRSWTLEEVLSFLEVRDDEGKPVHEFYTRHPKTGKTAKVFARPRKPLLAPSVPPNSHWIATRGNKRLRDNLDALPQVPEVVACDVLNHCPVIPSVAVPVYRGHGADF